MPINYRSLKEEIKKLPISEVVDSRMHGSRLSPFREDQTAGSFMVSDERGICTDFAEGVSRDQIQFIMDFDQVDFKEASLRIALQFGLIDEKTYQEESKNKSDSIKPLKKEVKNVEKAKEAQKQPDDVLNYVYSRMKVMCLDEEDRDYLLDRGVPEEELKNYFSYNEYHFPLVLYKMAGDRFDLEKLIGVPGFYREDGKIQRRIISGIAIPMKNADGNITAIQIRKSKCEKGEARYVFLSSSGLNEGCSCGAQVDIEAPMMDGPVWITEGHFKACAIRRHFGNTAISVQGVNNIKPLIVEIPKLLKKRNIEKFIIAFDADMWHNKQVMKAANKLHNMLKNYNIPVVFATWDEKDGKGIDDCLQNNGKITYLDNLKSWN